MDASIICRCMGSISKKTINQRKCPLLMPNVPAAWRQAGVSQKFGRELTMMLPAHFQTSQHPRLRQTARYMTFFLLYFRFNS